MSLPRKIRNFNAFVDGVSFMGIATTASMPDLKVMLEQHRGSGMDGSVGIDVGLEAMKASITFAEWSPSVLKLFGTQSRLVLRPAAKGEDGEVDTIIVTVGGTVASNDYGDLKPGGDVPLKIEIDIRYFRFEHNGEVIYDIDLVAGKRIVNGVDQNAEMRTAMGL